MANEHAQEHANADDAPPAEAGTAKSAAEAEQRSDNAEQRSDNAEQRSDNGEQGSDNAEQRSDNAGDRPAPNNGSAEPESPGASGEHKQTICHRTRSASNPYVVITVDFHAVDGKLIESNGDHAGQHDATAVFDPEVHGNGDDWGDIIPEFTFEGATFPGLNWGTDGQAIFDNGCELPAGEETTVVEEDDEDDGDQTVPGGVEEDVVVEGDDEENVENEVVVTTPTVEVTEEAPAAPQQEALGEFGETAVLGDTVTRTPRAAAAVAGPVSGTLPRTGAGTGLLATLGAALVGAGFTLQRRSRRLAVTD